MDDASPLIENDYKIIAATFACLTAFVLFLTFFITATRFRLWHDNRILKGIPELVDNPVTWLITTSSTIFTTVPYRNDLYSIWLIVFIIAYDNVLTISAASTPGSSWLFREYVSLLFSIYLGISIFGYTGTGDEEYRTPLLVLWSLVLAKFSLRLLCHKLVERAYGLNNTKLVSDFMKIEHELVKPNGITDPRSMKGYNYLVMGEGKISPKVKGPEYTADIELTDPDVVTVEKVWSCNKRLLDPSVDDDNRLRDVCLSFAFFKLLKRRFYEYPAAEAQQEKTRQLVFDGLLSRNSKSIYMVIEMEIGFIRDFFYTRYPVIFAWGFPVFQVILLTGMLGVSLWIAVMAFNRREDPENSYLEQHKHNIDYTITNILLIVMTVMEAIETLTYVFSDWAKVVLICRYVRGRMLHHNFFYDKVLAHLCKWKFYRSLNRNIGQYSILNNYNKKSSDRSWLNRFFRYSPWGWSPLKVAPKGTKKDKAVELSTDVKEAILESLRSMSGYPTNGVTSLTRNNVYGDLAYTCHPETDFRTLTVWHIATCLCEIHPVSEGGNKKSIEPRHLVASHLSKYCAYLMVFLPDMLPESMFSVKLFFQEILSETKIFFDDAAANGSEDKYNLMMQFSGHENRVIDMGMRLGRYLMEISDDAYRWKIIADFWAEFIIYLAPRGKVREHLKKLESGGEFITYLWALLYHAGIVHDTATASSGHHP